MKAFIHNQLTSIPDHKPHADRILIRVDKACRRVPQADRMKSWRSAISLVNERRRQSLIDLYHDGPAYVLNKARHMLRREKASFGRQYASFVGRVVADNTAGHLPIGTRVAGISLTHPSVTELVVARQELVWPIPDDVPEDLVALVLYGGLCVSAIATSQTIALGAVRLCDNDVLARLTLFLLLHRGIPVNLSHDAKSMWRMVPEQHKHNVKLLEGGSHAPITIVTRRRQEVIDPSGAGAVVGVDLSIDELRVQWPNAEKYRALDLDGMMKDPSRVLDLFYDDGPCQYPEWFAPDYFWQYLQAVEALGKIVSKAGVDVHTDSTNPAANQGYSKQIRDNALLDSGFVFFSFSGLPSPTPRPPTVAVNIQSKKHVSLIGGGRWGLGMVVRQMSGNDNILLRGVCDRRPEVAHMALQTLPFAYATTSIEDILEDEATDAVFITPYHGAHAPLAAAVLNAGKHCYVDKPPAVDADQLASLVDGARTSGKMLYVGYNRRFAPATVELMRHLRAAPGPITMNFVMRSIDIPANSWYYWPSNGNRIISNVCHLIDYSLHVAAHALPTRISVSSATVGRPDQNVFAKIDFDDGSVANLVYTDRGKSKVGYFQHYLFMRGEIIAELRDFVHLQVRATGKVVGSWRGVQDMGHRHQMETYADALVRDGPAPVSLYDTLVSAKTLLGAAESSSLGRPVDLTFDEYLPFK